MNSSINIDTVISQLKRGKAAGLDNITAEHLQSHSTVFGSKVV